MFRLLVIVFIDITNNVPKKLTDKMAEIVKQAKLTSKMPVVALMVNSPDLLTKRIKP